MGIDFEKCTEPSNYKIVSVEENGKTFTIENPKSRKVGKVTVDGCLIVIGKRCDYLFEIDNPITEVMYVELKGSDIEHAYEQLCATIGDCKQKHGSIEKSCYIIPSKVRKARGLASVESLQKKMLKEHGIKLVIRNNKHTVTI
ncbi:hypothetical protein MCHI_000945 [Candidatus Magnetoovum chiemensis]|nr:hypothetical protein MCHI_000945 [Candidatus Magnetoovum chiemensis]